METEDNNQTPVPPTPPSTPLQLLPLGADTLAKTEIKTEITSEIIPEISPNLNLNPPVVPAALSAEQLIVPKKKTLSITIKDKAVLYAAYMPFLKNGGLFIPTKKLFNMGEECSLVISLLDDDERYSVVCRVVWITPQGSPTNKAGGIGVEFSENTDGELLRRKIEDMLGTLLKSDNATHTM